MLNRHTMFFWTDLLVSPQMQLADEYPVHIWRKHQLMPALTIHSTYKFDKMNSFNISDSDYKQIEQAISSEESVVGIDAKKTHIIILHMLNKIEERLDIIESRLDDLDKS